MWMLRCLVFLGGACLLFCGCEHDAKIQYTLSENAQELPEPLQQQILETLDRESGTPEDPKLLGDPNISRGHLLLGQRVYQQRCAACHGPSGDGNGPAAEFLNPKPRDYRRGIFKFTSTPFGARPLRADLVRTVRQGIVGTSMPSFALLPDDELQSVVDYVQVLTRRGELEEQLVVEAENEDEIDDEIVPDLIELVLERWADADSQVVMPLSPEPPMTEETIAQGREAFLNEQQGCFKCHGADGRGGSVEGVEVGKDVWGQTTAAADLTSGMLHGGQTPLDVYRRIYGGINGTPMPAFSGVYRDDPDTFWHLVHYVLSVANKRREGEFFLDETATRPPEVSENEDASVENSSD